MPTIPKLQQYYPSVSISELTDLYSIGANTIDSKRLFIGSMLSKTLRMDKSYPFTNAYFLFIEDTEIVDGIDWSFQLYNRGEEVTIASIAQVVRSPTKAEYTLFFGNDSIDLHSEPVADRLVVTCKVVLADETVVLSVEHNIVQALDSEGMTGIDVQEDICVPMAGNPEVTNYILNHLKDYLPNEVIKWNNEIIERDLSGDNSNNLLKIIIGLLYNNIQTSRESTLPTQLYNIHHNRDKGLEAYFNDAREYNGDYVVGISRLPLHFLNDVFENIDNIPDFTTIGSDGGNPIYNILRKDGETDEEEKVEASIDRIKGAPEKLRELYNLTLFPKSAIKLAAIYFKYLLEASKLNACKECRFKKNSWPNLIIDDLLDEPVFVRNLFSHYLKGPTGKVKVFKNEIREAVGLIWSPAIYLVVNIEPRIITSYFAKRVIEKLPDEIIGGVNQLVYKFKFERLDSKQFRIDPNGDLLIPDFDSPIGREVYLISETLHSRGAEMTFNINPSDLALTGNKDIIEVASGNAGVHTRDILKNIGDYSDLINNVGDDFSDPSKTYFKVDHQDRFIVKINLRPETSLEFKAWTDVLLAQISTLALSGKYSDDSEAYFGNSINETLVSQEFLTPNDNYYDSKFRVVSRIVYEIYHPDNDWNFLRLVGGNRPRIGKVINHDVNNDLIYYCHDKYHNEHMVCERTRFLAREKGARRNAIPGLAARGALIGSVDYRPNRRAGEGVDAEELTMYANGTLAEGVYRDRRIPNDTGDRWYRNTGNDIYLINADVFADPGIGPANFLGLDYFNQGRNGYELRIRFYWQDTRRRFANPDLFSGIIGALAFINQKENPIPNPLGIHYENVEVISEGLAYEDASCYPSTSHKNGLAFDTHYMDPFDIQQAFIHSLNDYLFGRHFTGQPGSAHTGYAGATADNSGLHDDHLHSFAFDAAQILDIIN